MIRNMTIVALVLIIFMAVTVEYLRRCEEVDVDYTKPITTQKEDTVNWEAIQTADYHTVACLDQQYVIVMPSFEGIPQEEILILEEQYVRGFCNSLN